MGIVSMASTRRRRLSPKPFAFRELMARLRALTRRQIDSRSADRLPRTAWTRPPQRRGIQRKDDRPQPHRIRLLEVLMRNEGRVLSQSQILDHVWGYDSWPGVESRRRLCHLPPAASSSRSSILIEIRAVRGVGYVLGA